MTDKSKYFIDKTEMYNELVKSNEQGKATEELGLMFMKMAEKYSHDRKFRDYERRYGRAFKEDLIATGLHACIKAWPKFDIELYDNPFSFFTTCLFRAYIGYLSKEYKFSNVKNALKIKEGMRGDYGYEEMIKEKEAAERVEDEEEHVEPEPETTDDAEEEEDVDTSDFNDDDNVVIGVDDDDSEEDPDLNTPTPKRINDHLDSMTLWGEDEVETHKPTIRELFGVKNG